MTCDTYFSCYYPFFVCVRLLLLSLCKYVCCLNSRTRFERYTSKTSQQKTTNNERCTFMIMMIVHVIRMFRTRNFKYLYYYYKVHMPLAEKAKHKSNVTTTEATSKYLWNLNGSLCVNVF